MTRQRMYVFEQAYVDYLHGLTRFSRRVWNIGVGVWNWFWSGTGAMVIEFLLQLSIVGGAVFAGYLYVSYEYARGRVFSLGTLGSLMVITVFVIVILWGWKAFVHLIARTLSGVSASSLVLGLSFGAILLTTAMFVPYLLALSFLTAVSFIVFLPIRGVHVLWLLHRHITYRCPYDDCSYSGMPIHVCSCGTRYADLQPSFYGIFHHTCLNGHRVKLPTLDILGRNKLNRLCGRCKRPLIFSALGELAEKPIGIIGGPRAGKTVFLRQSTRELVLKLAAQPGSSAQVASPEQASELSDDLDLMDRGQLVAKTTGDVMQAFGIAARLSREQRYLLYLFDAPGEHFLRMEQLGRKQSLQHLAGIILFVDPFSLPELVDHALHDNVELKPSEINFHRVVEMLIAGVNLVMLKHPTEVCHIPLAVVMGKADALPIRDFPSLQGLLAPSVDCTVDRASERCRKGLEALGGRSSIHSLEQKFSNVHYFACSALGRMPDPRDHTPFKPIGVTEPFLWMMQQWNRREIDR